MMDPRTFPILMCIAVAALATATVIYQFVPSYQAFLFRRLFARLAVQRVVTTCRHAFDPGARRVDRYARTMVDLETAAEFRDGLERRMAEDLGQAGVSAMHATTTYAVVDGHLERKRAAAARYLASMADEDIVQVAGVYQRGILKGEVAQASVEEFFRDERELVRATPHMAAGHFSRMEHRFNRLQEEALARPNGTV